MNIYGEDLDFLDALDNQYQSETDDDTSPISKVATVLGDNSVDEEYTKELEEENRANAELNQEIEKEYQEEQEEQEDNDLEDDILSLFDENTNWNSDNLDDDLSEIVPFNTGWNVKNRNVNFEKVNNQFKSILEPIAGGLLFTSTTGDSHTKNSLHPYGRAVDVRANEQSRRIFENPEVLRYLNSNGVKVVFEKAGANSKTTAPHWHLEYRQNGGEIETIIAQTGRFNRFSSNPFSVMSYGSSIPEVGLNTQNYKRNLVANNLSDYYPQQNIGVGIQNGYNPNRDFVDNVMNSSRDPQDITTNPVGLVDDPDEIYIDPGTAVAPIVEDTPTVERNPYQSFQDKVLSDPFTNGQAISSSNSKDERFSFMKMFQETAANRQKGLGIANDVLNVGRSVQNILGEGLNSALGLLTSELSRDSAENELERRLLKQSYDNKNNYMNILTDPFKNKLKTVYTQDGGGI